MGKTVLVGKVHPASRDLVAKVGFVVALLLIGMGVVAKDQAGEAPPRVHVVSSRDSAEASADIIRQLERLSVDASAPAPTDRDQVRAVVVLLSPHGLGDAVWRSSVEALRAERLVPVRVGAVADEDVPQFLRDLNWVFYRPDDPNFVAQLFTGINTDASRFRDSRDTRALAERWESAGRSPDYLLERRREVNQRISIAAASADGSDPLIPREQAVQLVGTYRDRRRFFRETLIEGDDALPGWLARVVATGLAALRGTFDKLFVKEGTTPVAFLAASRRNASRRARVRVWRASYRTMIAALAVAAVVFTGSAVQQAIRKSTNAVSFAIGDTAETNRPDVAAIKAGASLIDSGTHVGDDGRFRIAVDALSRHWPLGYLSAAGSGISSASFLQDGSIQAIDFGGTIWRWNISAGSRTSTATGLQGVRGADTSPDGALTVASDGGSIAVVGRGAAPVSITGLGGIVRMKLAPAHDRLLVQAGDALYTIDGVGTRAGSPKKLGDWDTVMDVARTTDGHAVALAERKGQLQIVQDDGTVVSVGPAPEGVSDGSLAPDGRSFALDVAGTVWTGSGGTVASSGIAIPGVEVAMAMTSDGLVLVSDRTRGAWVADPRLGIDLGTICGGGTQTTQFDIDGEGARVLCLQSGLVSVDSLLDVRPAATGVQFPNPARAVVSDGEVRSLSLIDGIIRLDRADGVSFAFDAAGQSLVAGFTRPKGIADVDFFGTGALIEASGLPTTVAVNATGSTFAVGFVDGRLIEVDVDASGHMAPVGSWQLPDHVSVSEIAWSADGGTISATTSSGTTWKRPSCSGCWGARTLTEHIVQRAWFCYDKADIDQLGDTARKEFRLRDCESRWGDAQ